MAVRVVADEHQAFPVNETTRILHGERQAEEEFVPLVYDELPKLRGGAGGSGGGGADFRTADRAVHRGLSGGAARASKGNHSSQHQTVEHSRDLRRRHAGAEGDRLRSGEGDDGRFFVAEVKGSYLGNLQTGTEMLSLRDADCHWGCPVSPEGKMLFGRWSSDGSFQVEKMR